MYWVLIAMTAGFLVGLLLRGRAGVPVSKATFATVCLLLFAMGLGVGSNKELISNLPTVGLSSLVIGFFTLLFSAVATRAFKNLYFRLKSRDEESLHGDSATGIGGQQAVGPRNETERLSDKNGDNGQ